MTEQLTATAAASGASATERFLSKKGAVATSKERVSLLAGEVLAAVHDVIRRHEVTYEEYDALKAWMIQVGLDGEWPLFLDVWVEHAVEDVNSRQREGSKGTIEGPYYIPGAPTLTSDEPGAEAEAEAEATLPMRTGEEGTPLLFQGRVTDITGQPLVGATLEMWQADDAGYYSQFAPGIPEWNLRGTVHTGAEGRFAVSTIQPAPYQIPTDGACGKLIAAAGWHAWRPAHLHLKVSAPGHQLITTQLYFTGGKHLSDDVASAVKPELVLDPKPAGDGAGVGSGTAVTYDFVLDPA